MRRFGAAVIAVFLALCGAAGATPPNTPTITEPGTDNMVLNAGRRPHGGADVLRPGRAHPPLHRLGDRDRDPAAGRLDRTLCVTGVSRVHIHLGDGAFVNAHAGRHELKFETNYKLRVRFKDSTSEFSAWRERPFSTARAGPPGVPSPIPWAVRQPGYVVEVVATGFQLPVNIAFVPNPGTNPADPFFYVTELYGKIKVVTRSGTVSDYATGLLELQPDRELPRLGRAGPGRPRRRSGDGDLFASMVYEDTASTANPKPHYPEGRAVPQQRRRPHRGDPDDREDMPASRPSSPTRSRTSRSAPTASSTSTWATASTSPTALNLNSYRGKILRMNLDGTAPTDNPFYNAADGINARDYVFAYGLRNPFGGAWRAVGRHALRGRERPEHRPLREGPGGPELRLERQRRHHAQLRALQLGAGARPGEHRVRPAGDLRRQRVPGREDGPRLRHRVRPDLRDRPADPRQAHHRIQPDADGRLRRHDAA